MIPLVSHVRELSRLRALVDEEVHAVLALHPKVKVRPKIGTMIEVPRAALTADAIAEYADFFSFGTNDLTQTAYALSRDDAGKFLSTTSTPASSTATRSSRSTRRASAS